MFAIAAGAVVGVLAVGAGPGQRDLVQVVVDLAAVVATQDDVEAGGVAFVGQGDQVVIAHGMQYGRVTRRGTG